MFTRNRVCGAPVIVSRARVPASGIRAVVINSGNSNACTGEPGIENARRMTAAVAAQLDCAPDAVLVCSTGVIGVPLPMDRILPGIPPAVSRLSAADLALSEAAAAILTTDSFAKLVSCDLSLSGVPVRVTGVAKGAAMIAPNMATMLAVVMTDAVLTPEECDHLLRHAVDRTFNCISVDGHTSTSDTVLLLASGASGGTPGGPDDFRAVQDAVLHVCRRLATDIIRDAEGASHFITVDVSGLATRTAAFRMAKAIADSPLVKTAIAGGDPNWGRIVSAAGYCGVEFDPACVSLRINGTAVYRAGAPVPFSAAELSQSLKADREVHLELSLSGGPSAGPESVRFWTSDLTCEYVRLNSEYTT